MTMITVSGKAHLSVPADNIQMRFTLSTLNKDYGAVTAAAGEALDELRNALLGEGFAADDLKSSDFSVTKSYKNERADNGEYLQVFEGYICAHSLNVEFTLDTERLARIIAAVGGCKAEPQFDLYFTVADAAALRRRLIKAAYKDALAAASVLAEAAGKKLGELKNIEYGSASDVFRSETSFAVEHGIRANLCAAAVDIVPEEISAEESVRCVWETE